MAIIRITDQKQQEERLMITKKAMHRIIGHKDAEIEHKHHECEKWTALAKEIDKELHEAEQLKIKLARMVWIVGLSGPIIGFIIGRYI